jgi:hypothetical protein
MFSKAGRTPRLGLLSCTISILVAGCGGSGTAQNPVVRATPTFAPELAPSSTGSLQSTPQSATPSPTASSPPATHVTNPRPTSTAVILPPARTLPPITPAPTQLPPASAVAMPAQFSASCGGSSASILSTISFQIINNGHTTVNWNLTFNPDPYHSGNWGSATAYSGSLQAGQQTQVTVTPASGLCAEMYAARVARDIYYINIRWPAPPPENVTGISYDVKYWS